MQQLLAYLAEGYHIEHITLQGWAQRFSRIMVKMHKDDFPSKEIVSLNEPDFFEHVTHYKNVPIPGTSSAEFVYLENPNEYEEISAQFWEFVSGRSRGMVASGDLGIPPHLKQTVRREILSWISKEGKISIPGERAPRLFIDSCLISITKEEVKTTTLPREPLDLDDLQLLRTEQSKILLLSPLWLSPKYPAENRDKFMLEVDPALGFCLVDLKKRDLVCLAIRTIRQCVAAFGKPPRNDVSFFITEMAKECLLSDSARTLLAPPAVNSDYTPIPWITFACLSTPFQRRLEAQPDPCLTLPEFLALGYPGLPGQFNSFQFRRRSQSLAVNLRFICSGQETMYNLRFDMSPGQPLLHIDFQILAPGHPLNRRKFLDHAPVSLQDLWSFNRTLYLGFLAAGGYDSYFDKLIEQRLQGFQTIWSQNAATGYPLMLRVFAKPKEDWLLANPKHFEILMKIVRNGLGSLSAGEKALIPELVSQDMFRDGGLTLLGEMLGTRLRT